MAQPLKVADPILVLLGLPRSTVTGTISVQINLTPLGYSLTGGNLAEFGWEASERTITLRPLSSQEQPVLYEFTFAFEGNFQLLGSGLQISNSATEAFKAVCVMGSSLKLANNVLSSAESVTMNLGIIVEDLTTHLTHNFSDPTIVFGPPQT